MQTTTRAKNLAVRVYKSADKAAVLILHESALRAIDAWVKSGRWDEDLNCIESTYLQNGTFLVGEINGRIVAMGALRRVSDSVGEIKRMRVDPEFQRKGYGQVILEMLEEKAKQLGYKKIVLDTTIKQTASQLMYVKNGYREVRREHIKTPNIDTELIYYEKELGL